MAHEPINAHFVMRAKERGIRSDPAAIYLLVAGAIRLNLHGLVEKMFDIQNADAAMNEARSLWRCTVPGEPMIFVIAANNTLRPVTILTEAQAGYYRDRHKWANPKGPRPARAWKK